MRRQRNSSPAPFPGAACRLQLNIEQRIAGPDARPAIHVYVRCLELTYQDLVGVGFLNGGGERILDAFSW